MTEQLRRRLQKTSSYDFTEDYVSEQTNNWSIHLGELRDRCIRILEIGSYEGRSAVWFVTHLANHPESHIVCVDPFCDPALELRFDHNLRLACEPSRFTKLKGFSGDVVPSLAAESFDLVYVDGSHRAADVLFDAVLAWRVLKNDGFLLFDDYQWCMEKLLHARPELGVDLFMRHFEGEYDLIFKQYQVLLKKHGGPR